MNWSDTIEARKVRCGRTMMPVHVPAPFEYHRIATAADVVFRYAAIVIVVGWALNQIYGG